MATVYLARDLRHGREVAIKVLHPEFAMALGTDRFLREIQLTAGLSHPHILPLLDSGQAGTLPYYVMPLVAGGSLRARLARDAQLPLDEALALTREVASALAYAHRAGIVHRDIKPENILLQDGHALVADFGIAKAVDAVGMEQLTETGLTVGTPAYMSPEQAGGSRRVDGRSDQYSLACVLYETLAGAPPFLAPSSQALLARHALDPVPSVRTVRPTVPVAVERVLLRALAKAPADRFPTTEAFARALEGAGEEAPTAVAPVRAAWPHLRAWAAVVVAAGVLAAAWVVLGRAAVRSAPLDPHRLAILPFTARCTTDYATWCDGVSDLLSVALDRAGDVRTVEARAVQGLVRARGAGERVEEQGPRVARALGAGRYVTGSASEVGGEFRLTAALYETGRAAPITQASARGAGDRIYSLIDGLTEQLLLEAEGGASGRTFRLAAATTDSLEALKAFLRGEAAIRAGRFEEASTHLQEAVGRDSAFALGWARLAEVAGYSDNAEVGGLAAERALRLADRLPRRDSLFVAAAYGTDFDHSERLYRALIDADSTDAGAWAALGDLLLHQAPVRGRPVEEARAAFRRAVALGDTSWRNVNHLNWAAGMARDSGAYDSLVQEDLARFPNGWLAPMYRFELAALHRDTAAQRSALVVLRSGDQGNIWGATHRLVVVGRNLEAATQTAALLTEPTHSLATRAFGYELLASLAAGRGRWHEAERHLEEAARFDPASALEINAYLALVPLLPVPRATVDSLQTELSRTPRASAAAADEAHHGLLRDYLLGLLEAHVGLAPAAEARASRISSLPATPAASMAAGMAAGIRASAMLTRGRAAEALRLLEDRWASSISADLSSPFEARTYERFLRAELLDRLDRPDEAVAWYDAARQQTVFDGAYLAPSLYRSGAVLERSGRPREAADRYREFLAVWRDADPELRPLLDSARTRLAALSRR